MTKNEFIKIKIEYLLCLLYAPRGSAYRVNLCVFLRISGKTVIISPYSISWLVFMSETESVYWAVRNYSLNQPQFKFRL